VRQDANRAGDADADREEHRLLRFGVLAREAGRLSRRDLLLDDRCERLLRTCRAAEVKQQPLAGLRRSLQPLQRRRDTDAVERERRPRQRQRSETRRDDRGKTMPMSNPSSDSLNGLRTYRVQRSRSALPSQRSRYGSSERIP
jgi:hypothetical protein